MTEKLFNSDFENSLRIVLLLNLFDMPQTLEMLYAVDFITVYGATFGISDYNLNGDNPYMFSEFTSRREIVWSALKELIIYDMALPINMDNGFNYVITPTGEDYAESLSSSYAKEYSRTAKKVIRKFKGFSDVMLIEMINKESTKSPQKGEEK